MTSQSEVNLPRFLVNQGSAANFRMISNDIPFRRFGMINRGML